MEENIIDIAEVGRQIYEQTLRAELETLENRAKWIFIDIETHDYEIVDVQNLVEGRDRLRAKNPEAKIYSTSLGLPPKQPFDPQWFMIKQALRDQKRREREQRSADFEE